MKLLLLLVFLPLSYVSAQTTSTLEYDTVYTRPEVPATYPGGDEAWKKYVKKKMKYPRKAWWGQIESEAQVKLVIDKDGTVSQVQHLTVSDYGFEQEAVRLVMKSGKWKPAIHRGRLVKSEGLLTINFRLR